jgi:hypothetical protein
MSTILKDGAGKGYSAKICSHNRLHVDAIARSIQFNASTFFEDAYQAFSTTELSGTQTIGLHLTNNNPNKLMIITYIRHQLINTTFDLPNVNNYFYVSKCSQYDSNGTPIESVNLRCGSANTSNVIGYSNPTVTGIPIELDR